MGTKMQILLVTRVQDPSYLKNSNNRIVNGKLKTIESWCIPSFEMALNFAANDNPKITTFN
jgi:hypothetical protein